MTYFDKLLIFFMFVVPCYCEDTTIISKYVDEDVSFDCFHSKLLDSQNCSRIKWIKYSSNRLSSEVIFARPETPGYPNAERIKWDPKDRQNVLLLTEVQKSDEGVYNCQIWSGWECIFTKNFTLKIKDCKSSVRKVLLGSVVILGCSEENQARIYNNSWFMLKFGNPVPLPSRFQVNGSTLSVRSAQASDSGWYRCEYRLGDTQQRCVDINVLVQEPPVKVPTKMTQAPLNIQTDEAAQSSTGKGFSAGQTVGVLVGVVIISAALVVGAVFYWKHNKNVPEEPPEFEDFVEYDAPYAVAHLGESTNQHGFQQGQYEEICTF